MFFGFIKKRWPLLAILAIFVFFKYDHLNSPFYWDESWPYASGVYKMFQNGASLLPGSIDGELSRGHPLLFHFLGAVWMNIFGISIFSLHSYALFISVLFLIFIYEVTLGFLDVNTAVFALILVAFQQMYFVQAAFVLLEILLAALVFASIYFYATKRFVHLCFTLILLFYTKESGLVLGLILGIDAIVQFFNDKNKGKAKWIPIVALLLPLLAICAFFVLQKKISGWYVLPLYSNGFEQTWQGFYDKFRSSAKVVFRDDFRRYYFTLFTLFIVCFGIVKKRYQLLSIAITAFLVFLVCSDKFHSLLNGVLLLILFTFSLILTIIILNRVFFEANKEIKRLFLISVVFCICFMVFTAYNLFFIDRYLISILVPILFLSAVYFSVSIQMFGKNLVYILVLIAVSFQSYAIKFSKSLGDNQIGAFDGMYIHKEVANYLVKNYPRNTKIGAGGFLEVVHLKDSNTRYITSDSIYANVSWVIDSTTEIAIFDNIEPDIRYASFLSDSSFKLVFRVAKGEAWGEIYKRCD
jgi:hypothetical protein